MSSESGGECPWAVADVLAERVLPYPAWKPGRERPAHGRRRSEAAVGALRGAAARTGSCQATAFVGLTNKSGRISRSVCSRAFGIPLIFHSLTEGCLISNSAAVCVGPPNAAMIAAASGVSFSFGFLMLAS